jgi:hypothetical protein
MGNSLSIHKVRKEVPEFFGLVQWHFIFRSAFFYFISTYLTYLFSEEDVIVSIQSMRRKKKQKGKTEPGLHDLWMDDAAQHRIDDPLFCYRSAVAQICLWSFALETVAVEAFGISWITKGKRFGQTGSTI